MNRVILVKNKTTNTVKSTKQVQERYRRGVKCIDLASELEYVRRSLRKLLVEDYISVISKND